MSANTLFITGTDTGVGKTYVACAILRHLRSHGVPCCGFKPISCGDREDAELLSLAAGNGELDEINPVWFETAAAPFAAARIEGKKWDHSAILSNFYGLCARYDWVIVEGAGGWEVPLSEGKTFADLAADFASPVLVVAANRLGALNHTLLTCAAIESRQLACVGIVLNEPEDLPESERVPAQTNQEVLRTMLQDIPVTVCPRGERSFDPAFFERMGM